jgi:ubiquinone biosynthesis protein
MVVPVIPALVTRDPIASGLLTVRPAVPITVIVLVLLLAAAVSRLLGVRQPLGRAILIGSPGLAVGLLTAYLVYRHNPGHVTALVWVAGVVAAVVATMLLMVLAELLSRPGRQDPGGGVPHPLRVLRRMVQRSRRYWQLTRIATRYGLVGIAGSRRGDPGQLGRRLRLALEEAGPIFVKLGQVLSTRTDLLPDAVTVELAELQDNVPPTPWLQIRTVLEEELAKDPGEIFRHVDPEPLASASLAQAHAARRADGSSVILKVQRPGIAELVSRDLDLMRRLTRRLELQTEWARSWHVGDLSRGFADALTEELDFRVEARNIVAIATATPADVPVLIPAVHTDISSRRLLVMERFDGVSIRDAGPELDRLGADRNALARELLGYLLRQILVQGTFHADPHPGNVLFLHSGQLALIDFGSVGRLDINQQAALRRLLLAIAQRDPPELYDAIAELAVMDHHDEESVEQTLASFMTQRLGPGMPADVAFIRSLLALLVGIGISFPPAIGGVFRALVTLEGTLHTLAPGFDIANETRALAWQFAGEQLMPESLRDAAASELLTLLPLLRKLPRRVDRISAALVQGRFTINQRLFSDPRDVSVVTSLVNRALLGLLGSALGVMSVILLLAPGSPRIVKGLTLVELLGYIGLFLSITLIFRVVLDILNPRRRR